MTPVPAGYKLCKEGEEIKSDYISYIHNFMDGNKIAKWQNCAGIFAGCHWNKSMPPMANPYIKSEEDKLKDIVKAALKLYSINNLRKFVPNYELQAINNETGLDFDTLIKIRDIVQGG